MNTIRPYPLAWPTNRERTPHYERRAADTFRLTLARARDSLLEEVHRLGGDEARDSLVVSSNMPTRNDGQLRADAREPGDPGVAVYFDLEGRAFVLACDSFDAVRGNVRALAKHIEAMRGMERWGCGTMTQLLAGFRLLPYQTAPPGSTWRELFDGCECEDEIERRYRKLAQSKHPDRGGSTEAFSELQAARDRALKAVGVTP